jgi:hypothetical protein
VDDLLTIPRPALRPGRPELVPAFLVALVLAAVFVLLALSLRPPDTVTLTVDNPIDYRADLSVRSADGGAWTNVGSVARNGSLQFAELPDQGADWIVRFGYAGQVQEVEVSRQALADDGWTIQVPEELGSLLEADGIPPTPGG